jgi:hypothetical protein
MNMQERSDRRSLAIHQEVVNRLKKNPTLWKVPLRNLERWEQLNGNLSAAQQVWRRILTTESREAIVAILLSGSEESKFLRSSSPFVGIIDQETRERIFRKFSVN